MFRNANIDGTLRGCIIADVSILYVTAYEYIGL
jgi:hypothetical protein